MKTKHLAIAALLLALFATAADAQLLKRTIYKNDRFDFGVGGTIEITGAPMGSIRIEGWSNREVEIEAEIEIQAPTEADLDRIGKVTGFVLQETLGRTGITSVGPHDKKAIRKVDKKFPKALYTMPVRINYVVRVPKYSDILINGGKGELNISGIDGMLRVNYIEAEAKIDLVGGGIQATLGAGTLDITIPSRSWRGRFADVSVASGTIDLKLPAGLNAQFDGSILRTGRIENGYEGFKPRNRNAQFTERSIAATAGTGTIPLKFTVGDGTLTIKQFDPSR
ncbi:MAG: hypothetical protein KF762_15295 [Acidobacteria bacterium]|nr:hypothetical protein [Acidobacteriota bacterium]